MMTFSTWACLRCLLELATIFGPQNHTQGRCVPFVRVGPLVHLAEHLPLVRPHVAGVHQVVQAREPPPQPPANRPEQ